LDWFCLRLLNRIRSFFDAVKSHGVDAFAYLRDVLKELPKLGSKPSRTALLQLLPDRWSKR